MSKKVHSDPAQYVKIWNLSHNYNIFFDNFEDSAQAWVLHSEICKSRLLYLSILQEILLVFTVQWQMIITYTDKLDNNLLSCRSVQPVQKYRVEGYKTWSFLLTQELPFVLVVRPKGNDDFQLAWTTGMLMTGKQREVGQWNYQVGLYKPWMKIWVCDNSPNQALFFGCVTFHLCIMPTFVSLG